MSPRFYQVLSQISLGYSCPQGMLPMCYAPVCLVNAKALAIDLHALDTPPAFILSQDQTLKKYKRIKSF